MKKLWLMASVANAFLLTLLLLRYDPFRHWLLRHYCHRTDRHCRQAHVPFARLRKALSRLWQYFPPRWERLARQDRVIVEEANCVLHPKLIPKIWDDSCLG